MLIKLNLFISGECDNRRAKGILLAIIVNLLIIAIHNDLLRHRPTLILVQANHIHRISDPAIDEIPTFIIRQTICNYKENPIQIYSFEKKIKPAEKFKPDVKIEYSLLGELDDKFAVNILNTHFRGNEEFQPVELVLNESLEIHELLLQLNAVRTERKGAEVLKQTVCEIKFRLTVEDCNSITWQSLTLIILASLSVLLFSTLAIMFSLYQQKDLNSSAQGHDDLDNDDLDTYNECDADDETNLGDKRRRSSFDYNNNNDANEDSSYNLHNTNMFINPRRSYDSSNVSRYSNSNVVDLNETQV